MDIASFIISICAIIISYFSYRNTSYRLRLAPYWNIQENKGVYPNKAYVTVSVINDGGSNVALHRIGATSSERDSVRMGNIPIRRRVYAELMAFEKPEVIPPKSSKEYEVLIEDNMLIDELDNRDAYIWIEDGMYNTYTHSIKNGGRNKKMLWTRKGTPNI